ncbi:MAG: hypothetical protein JWQ81_120 [Amycolatopsis sp.]|jgi:hypothetical protein|nr:hypothetical protein [Amycolatopsis sp.]
MERMWREHSTRGDRRTAGRRTGAQAAATAP